MTKDKPTIRPLIVVPDAGVIITKSPVDGKFYIKVRSEVEVFEHVNVSRVGSKFYSAENPKEPSNMCFLGKGIHEVFRDGYVEVLVLITASAKKAWEKRMRARCR